MNSAKTSLRHPSQAPQMNRPQPSDPDRDERRAKQQQQQEYRRQLEEQMNSNKTSLRHPGAPASDQQFAPPAESFMARERRQKQEQQREYNRQLKMQMEENEGKREMERRGRSRSPRQPQQQQQQLQQKQEGNTYLSKQDYAAQLRAQMMEKKSTLSNINARELQRIQETSPERRYNNESAPNAGRSYEEDERLKKKRQQQEYARQLEAQMEQGKKPLRKGKS